MAANSPAAKLALLRKAIQGLKLSSSDSSSINFAMNALERALQHQSVISTSKRVPTPPPASKLPAITAGELAKLPLAEQQCSIAPNSTSETAASTPSASDSLITPPAPQPRSETSEVQALTQAVNTLVAEVSSIKLALASKEVQKSEPIPLKSYASAVGHQKSLINRISPPFPLPCRTSAPRTFPDQVILSVSEVPADEAVRAGKIEYIAGVVRETLRDYHVTIHAVNRLPSGDLQLILGSAEQATLIRGAHKRWTHLIHPNLVPTTPFRTHAIVLHHLSAFADLAEVREKLEAAGESEVVTLRRFPGRTSSAAYGSAVAVFLHSEAVERAASSKVRVGGGWIGLEKWRSREEREERRKSAQPRGDNSRKKKSEGLSFVVVQTQAASQRAAKTAKSKKKAESAVSLEVEEIRVCPPPASGDLQGSQAAENSDQLPQVQLGGGTQAPALEAVSSSSASDSSRGSSANSAPTLPALAPHQIQRERSQPPRHAERNFTLALPGQSSQ